MDPARRVDAAAALAHSYFDGLREETDLVNPKPTPKPTPKPKPTPTPTPTYPRTLTHTQTHTSQMDPTRRVDAAAALAHSYF